MDLQDQGVIDSGCSRHMTGNMSYLTDYEEIDGGYVAFRGNPKGGKIIGKGTQSNDFADTKASDNACQARKETKPVKNYILLPLWPVDPPYSQDPNSSQDDGSKPSSDDGKKVDKDSRKDSEGIDQEKEEYHKVYVDDIIFGSTKKGLWNAFEKLMHEQFQMSSIGELTFFLGLQVEQKKDGLFISQDKYVGEILNKFGFIEVKTASTPIETQKPLLKDENGEEVDVYMYRSMIGSLMYLTSSRPDIMFAACACARYQVNPKICLLLMTLKVSAGKAMKSVRLMMEELCKNRQSDSAKTINEEVQLQALVDGKKIVITESTVRRDLQLENAEGVDCLPNATIFEQLALIRYEQVLQKLTFYKAFFSSQWKFLIHTVLQCLSPKTTTWNEFSSTMASVIICLAINQKFNFSKFIFESMVKNLDNVGKFLMYPRFIQVFLDKQLEGMLNRNRIYVTPSHTKKIFRNIRRVGKGFPVRVTPFFPTMVVQNQQEMGEGLAMPTDPQHTPTFIQPSTSQPQKTQKPRKPKRKGTQVPRSSVPNDNVADKAVYKELGDSLVRVSTTASSLEAKHDSGNIIKTRSKATLNEVGSQGTTSGGGPKRQETMRNTIVQTRFENVSKLSNDQLLARGNTLQSGEDSLKLNELMELCTNLQQMVLDLETTKATQANEIASLKRRVKKLEKKDRSRTHKLKRLYKVGLSARVESSGDEEDLGEDASKQGRRIHDIDADEDITLVNDDNEIFDVDALAGEEVFVAEQSGNVVEEVVAVIDAASTIPVSAATITDVEITLAQALAELKSAKPKADKVVIQEPEQGTTTTTPTTIIPVPKPPQDKGKGIMIEEPVVEQVKPMKRLEQMRLDEELALKLQAEEK
ncbi:ribonuclease H-like domain-containing protein [Tanacetum coccineum]|uniref:Ribonuclease H-like domain-containing protein n=1 Tax=Tanacetum coccineum TaxID=301880 RepID=A0ABQ4WF02_9ASTR